MRLKLPDYKEKKRKRRNRKLIISFLLFLLTLILSLITFDSSAQHKINPDSTGLPGDHFDLKACLEVFKTSKSPEDFEKKLNTKSSLVNNLDLNRDGKTDYIKVEDKSKGEDHALILQVEINENETQDIAIIEIEKTSVERAQLQVLGIEEIYGTQKIIEPSEESQPIKDDMWDGNNPDNNNSIPAGNYYSGTEAFEYFFVNVWFWPCVQFIYNDSYVIWISPWYWNYYPGWWQPWSPYPYYWYHQSCLSYSYYYMETNEHHTHKAHAVYLPHKKTSGFIYKSYEEQRNHYQNRKEIQKINTEKFKIDQTESEPLKKDRSKSFENKTKDRKLKIQPERPKNNREKINRPRR